MMMLVSMNMRLLAGLASAMKMVAMQMMMILLMNMVFVGSHGVDDDVDACGDVGDSGGLGDDDVHDGGGGGNGDDGVGDQVDNRNDTRGHDNTVGGDGMADDVDIMLIMIMLLVTMLALMMFGDDHVDGGDVNDNDVGNVVDDPSEDLALVIQGCLR